MDHMDVSLRSVVNDYFEAWDVQVATTPELQKASMNPNESPAYMTAFSEYIRHHAGTYPVKRALLSDDDQVALQEMEDKFYKELMGDSGWVIELEGFSAHWAIRDHQQAEFKRQMESPQPNWLHFHWGFQEPEKLKKHKWLKLLSKKAKNLQGIIKKKAEAPRAKSFAARFQAARVSAAKRNQVATQFYSHFKALRDEAASGAASSSA
eukprot:UN3990